MSRWLITHSSDYANHYSNTIVESEFDYPTEEEVLNAIPQSHNWINSSPLVVGTKWRVVYEFRSNTSSKKTVNTTTWECVHVDLTANELIDHCDKAQKDHGRPGHVLGIISVIPLTLLCST